MAQPSIDLRRHLVAVHESNKGWTYAATAKLFGIDEATVRRVLHCYWDTGDVLYRRNTKRRIAIDLDWLRQHLEANPEARLVDRITAWKAESGRPVSIAAMWLAVRACGWAYQDRRWVADRKIAPISK